MKGIYNLLRKRCVFSTFDNHPELGQRQSIQKLTQTPFTACRSRPSDPSPPHRRASRKDHTN